MSSIFEIKEHIISASHIREYPRATTNRQDDVLLLHVKQYTPKSNPAPQNGDISIIGAHANGFPKAIRAYIYIFGLFANPNTIGTIRAPLGRILLPNQETRLPNPGHLDC